MTFGWPIWLLLVGCGGTQSRGELSLEGPARISVDRLGPVEGPRPVDEDGQEVEDIEWTASPDVVARVHDGEVHAVGPGEAIIEGTWGDETIRWTLRVEPAIALRILDPPGTLHPGETTELAILGRLGEETVDPGPITWRSSDPEILTVDERGVIRARSPGVAYVTANGGRTEAMVEIVVAP